MKPKKDEILSISKAIYKHYNINKDDLYIDPERIAIIFLIVQAGLVMLLLLYLVM